MSIRKRPPKPRPESVRAFFYEDLTGAVALNLPPRRTWIGGLVMGLFFVIFLAIDCIQIASLTKIRIRAVFDLMFALFQSFWILGWSVGVFILGALTFLLLFYGEDAYLRNGRLFKVSRLGPLRFRAGYALDKTSNWRVETEKSLKGPERARLYFDYEGSTENLGDSMPAEKAGEILAAVRSAPRERTAEAERPQPGWDMLTWVDGMAARRSKKMENLPRVEALPRETEPPAWDSPSTLALLAANLIPLAGVLFLGWSLGDVMVLFWAESAVIGFYNVLKLIKVARWGALFSGPFFVGHFGGFMAAHFLFIYYLFVRSFGTKAPEPAVTETLLQIFVPLWPALAALFISHGISFVSNFLGRREYAGRTAQQLMAEPYNRIVVMHVTIIFGGWVILLLKTPVAALVLLVGLKIAADLHAHRREHP